MHRAASDKAGFSYITHLHERTIATSLMEDFWNFHLFRGAEAARLARAFPEKL